MAAEAQRLQNRLRAGSEADVRGVVTAPGEFRARVRYSENGDPRVIKGPRRSNECHANADLELIIAAAAGMSGRAERFFRRWPRKHTVFKNASEPKAKPR
jgi:hypothetical protein